MGPKFPKFAHCLAFGIKDASCDYDYNVDISINGRKQTFKRVVFFSAFRSDHLWFYCRPLYSLQKLFQDLSLGDRNHVELFFEISIVGLTQV